jgi:hypothetical protein
MAVLERDNYRCQCGTKTRHCGLPHNAPCASVTGLQAHHTKPGNDDPATGVALCQACHRRHDPYAR